MSQLLRIAINDAVPGADVTIARPHAATDGANPESPTVNLYLYQVTQNSAWRNADLPTRTGDGELRQRPQAALDLHYLLTFYGNETELEPQRLLGSAVRTLHAQPILARNRGHHQLSVPGRFRSRRRRGAGEINAYSLLAGGAVQTLVGIPADLVHLICCLCG